MEPRDLATRRVLRLPEVRGANRGVVLQLLRQHGRMSRAELARRSGLSEGTVSRIVAELLEESLVAEDGAENSTGGRPGTRLRLHPARVAAGVEMQNWETRISVSDMHGRILATRSFRTPADPRDAVKLIAAHFRDGLQAGQELEGLGVSVRGIVNSDTGVVELGSRPGWVNYPLKRELEAVVQVPVCVENNVRAAASAEYCYGNPQIQTSHCCLFVKVDEGIGMGIVIDGRVYHGPRMAAGEFGQMVIAERPGPERHDRAGCLEKLAANPALCERYNAAGAARRAARSGDTTALVRRICHEALEGGAAARRAIIDTGHYLGVGIANVVWGLDADVVVLDGAVTEAWPVLGPAIRDEFPVSAGMPQFRQLVLRPSVLGGDAGIIGAATLPFIHLFGSGERSRAAGA